MALKDLIISHAEARDLKAIEMIDRLERHKAAIDFPTSDLKIGNRTISQDYTDMIRLLLDYRTKR